MKFTEITLETRDNVKLRSYIILQSDEQKAKKSPTILYFHVKKKSKICKKKKIITNISFSYLGQCWKYGKAKEGQPYVERGVETDWFIRDIDCLLRKFYMINLIVI